jgi:class 3 adenylate cyclase
MTSTEPRSNIVPCIAPCIHGPYHQPMAVMFVDLDHFMRICIDVPAEDVFVLIGEFQRVVTGTVSSFEGEINAYQGDGILVAFGNVADRADCATRALRCARTILEQINGLNLDQTIGVEVISASIGLQYGQVWSGTIGVSKHFGPTLIGDAVNVAVRLERLARELSTKMVLGDDFMHRLRCERATGATELSGFADAGPLFIGGRYEPINVWSLLAQASGSLQVSDAIAHVGGSQVSYPDDCSAQ